MNFVVLRQLGIVTAVAYWRDPYKKRGTFLATQNRGHITTSNGTDDRLDVSCMEV